MSEIYCLLEDVRLLGFGASETSGKWLKFEVLDAENGEDILNKFRGLKGSTFDVAIEPSETKEQRQITPKGPYGKIAQALKQSNFFRTPQVWEALGTDEEYREWIQEQPSCISGNFSEYLEESGEGRCVAAHVRRSNNAGTSIKPTYACVPLTDEEHEHQHTYGELRCLQINSTDNNWPSAFIDDARDWFDKKRIEYVSQWAWENWKARIGVPSMTHVPIDTHVKLAQDLGIVHLLPAKEWGL